jgi:hypothetical protein
MEVRWRRPWMKKTTAISSTGAPRIDSFDGVASGLKAELLDSFAWLGVAPDDGGDDGSHNGPSGTEGESERERGDKIEE